MSAGYSQPVVLDATVVSNFASTDRMNVLVNLLSAPVVVPAVVDEIERGRSAGHEYLDAAVEVFADQIDVRQVDDVVDATDLRARLDPGEAETIQAAIQFTGTVATDDLAARRVAEAKDLAVTGSVGLLVHSVERELIEEAEADEWLDTWRRRRGYYAPVESVSELLDDR